MGACMTTSAQMTTQCLLAVLGELDLHYAEAQSFLRNMPAQEAVALLVGVLDHGDAHQCVDAIRLLEDLQDPGAISALLAMQKHEHLGVRMAAAKALGNLRHWATVSGLMDWLQTEPQVMVRTWIIMSLGRLGDSEALPHLIAALREEQSAAMRYIIVRALGLLGNPEAIDAILPYVDDPDQHVRKDVEAALKRLRGEAGD